MDYRLKKKKKSVAAHNWILGNIITWATEEIIVAIGPESKKGG